MFKFNIFKKYFFIKYSKIVLNVTLAFLALGIVLNIFEEVNFFKDHAVGFLLPLSLTFLKVPTMIYKLFPFIFLFSSIILFLNFDNTEINLSSFSTKTTTYPKIQERDTLSLLNCIKPFLDESKTSLKQFQCRERIDDVSAEINRRLGMPLYIPFVSIIICYLLSSAKENKFYIFRKYIVFIAAFIVLVFAEIMVRYSGQATLYSIIYYSLPPLLILLNYLILIRIFKYENLGQ